MDSSSPIRCCVPGGGDEQGWSPGPRALRYMYCVAGYLGEVRAPSPAVPRSSKGTSGMQAHADRSTFHFHMRQYTLIPAETIDSLAVSRSKFFEPTTLMF